MYPACTFVQCECYQSMIMQKMSDNFARTKIDNKIPKILRFEIVDSKAVPIYKEE